MSDVIIFPPKKAEKLMEDYIKDILPMVIPDDDLRARYLARYIDELRTLSMNQWSMSLPDFGLPDDKRAQFEAAVSEQFMVYKSPLVGRIIALQLEVCSLRREIEGIVKSV